MNYKFPAPDPDTLANSHLVLGKSPVYATPDYDLCKPLFSYTYIDLIKTEYGFHQDCWEIEDIHKYFEIVKKISNLTIDELLDSNSQSYNFNISPPNKKTIELIKSSTGLTNLDYENCPYIGHFGINTNKKMLTNRENKNKSPRIHFILHLNIFYILFFDPYHEIHQSKEKY